ncbi:MAG: DNA repair protein RadC [Lachnospiraceae bacterium]|nr:DNA repair protein RadC [Lachnospiraceae bacterium]
MGNSMKELPESIRPYEKFMRYGEEALDDAELLAVILRSGTKDENVVELARKVLNACGGTLAGLNRLTEKELTAIPGIGKVKAITLKCVMAVSVRAARSAYAAFPDMSSPGKIAECFMEEMRHEDREQVRVLFLNGKSRLIAEKVLSLGGVNAAPVPVREILSEALSKDAVNMVLLHNHPSGDPEPSEADFEATERLILAGKLMNIPLLDHIIIGDLQYLSFREKGYIT